jgi:NAD-dependent dihydropyrimidine dehydrogenase PreA subunit
MTILNALFPRISFQGIEDYSRIINRILKLDVQFSILKFSLTERGIDVKLDVPDEKFDLVQKEFKKEAIKIKNHVIEIDEDLCIDCGACINLCNTDALYFNKELARKFEENKCVGCKLCVDACVRAAITFR